MFTRSTQFLVRPAARNLCVLGLAALVLSGATLQAADAAPWPVAASRAAADGAGEGPVVTTSGGRKAALIIGGLAVLGAGAALAAQGRRDAGPYGGDYSGPAYRPGPYGPPPSYQPQAYDPVDDEPWDYAPPPPAPVYGRPVYGYDEGYGYDYGGPARSYDRSRTRLLPEGR